MNGSGGGHGAGAGAVSGGGASVERGLRRGPNHGRPEPPSRGEIGRIVRLHLRDDSPKQIARRIAETSGAELSTETIRNWKRPDRGTPDTPDFLLLCRAYPALAAEARRLIAMDTDNDPAFQRALSAFVTAWQRGGR